MTDEITLVDDGEDPTVAWASSRSAHGTFYRITHTDGLFPRCACPAGAHGAECGHVLALMERQKGTTMPEETETKALTVARPSASASVTLRAQNVREALAASKGGFDDALFVAENVIGRQAWPDELRNDEQGGARKAALIVMTAAELGVSPTQAFSYITAIKGKPFLMARMVNALVSGRVPGGYISLTKRTITACEAVAHRPGRPDVKVEITIEMAKKAGWTTNRLYETNPAAMLAARVTTTVGWLQFADVLAGMDAAEEVDGQVVPFFAAEVEAVPAHGIAEQPIVEGESRDLPEDSGEAPPAAPEPPESVTAAEPAWFEDLVEMMKALGKKWGDVAEALDITITTREDVFRWGAEHREIAYPVMYIRSRLLRAGRAPVNEPEQPALPAV